MAANGSGADAGSGEGAASVIVWSSGSSSVSGLLLRRSRRPLSLDPRVWLQNRAKSSPGAGDDFRSRARRSCFFTTALRDIPQLGPIARYEQESADRATNFNDPRQEWCRLF